MLPKFFCKCVISPEFNDMYGTTYDGSRCKPLHSNNVSSVWCEMMDPKNRHVFGNLFFLFFGKSDTPGTNLLVIRSSFCFWEKLLSCYYIYWVYINTNCRHQTKGWIHGKRHAEKVWWYRQVYTIGSGPVGILIFIINKRFSRFQREFWKLSVYCLLGSKLIRRLSRRSYHCGEYL
jgi:hypothetical protein